MNAAPNPILVEAHRGGIVESVHRGSYAVVSSSGQVLHAVGDTLRPVFPRSAVKVLQALPLVESGAADALRLTDEELALACASHNGEPAHASTAASMLAKAGLDGTALECGSHWPYLDTAVQALARDGAQPSALHNNCSGKHAGFCCLGALLHRGAGLRGFVSGYVQPEHPVMQAVTASLQSTTGRDLSTTARGVDGCSIPTYAIPLQHLAHAFAKVATGQGLSDSQARAAKRLRQAVAAAPYMVAGTGRFDTQVMLQLRERVFCKVGAEGMHCAALPELGLGVAVKMDDGNNARAVEVVMAALIQRLLPLAGDDAALLAGLAERPLRNWRGVEVGLLKAVLPD